MQSREETFQGALGETLHGRLEQPTGHVVAYALFAHCFTCGKDSVAATRITRALAEKSIATLRFDFTGLGNSDGDFANTNFTTNIADLNAAVQHLSRKYRPPSLLLGHSLGGAAVLALAACSDLECAVATLGAPYDPAHVAHLLAGARKTIERDGVAEVQLGGRPLRIGKSFLDDLDKGHKTLQKFKKPLLVMHAPRDKIVGIENAEKIFRAAHHPKSFVSLDSADHLLLDRRDAEYAAHVIASWASRYMAQETPALAQGKLDEVAVQESLRSPLEQTILSGRHMLIADEPQKLGGFDRGPSPFDYVLAALGACTTITLRIYAKRKAIPLRRAQVRLMFEDSGVDRKHRLKRLVILEGDLDSAQRKTLLEIAEKCPVHRAYSRGMEVITEEARG